MVGWSGLNGRSVLPARELGIEWCRLGSFFGKGANDQLRGSSSTAPLGYGPAEIRRGSRGRGNLALPGRL